MSENKSKPQAELKSETKTDDGFDDWLERLKKIAEKKEVA